MRRIATIGVVFAGLALAHGCAAPLPVGSAEQRQRLAELDYPADAEIGQPLQLEVIRDGQHLRFINREPREFRRVTLWLNQQYAGVAERIAPGSYESVSANSVPLGAFINEHGEPFPVGRFLAPDDTIALVSAEMVFGQGDATTRRAMTVWPDKRWFED
ncbi:MAG: hypothetical protein AAGF84_02665 [Planctomycetota bacterium]